MGREQILPHKPPQCFPAECYVLAQENPFRSRNYLNITEIHRFLASSISCLWYQLLFAGG